MQPLPSSYALRARYVIPIDRPPLPGGIVTIDDQRVTSVTESLVGRHPIDLGNVAILPGLVNAHTHLEFSDLESPLGRAGMSLPDWIRLVLQGRSDPDRDSYQQRVSTGFAQCVRHGTTTVGEIATSDWLPTVPIPVEVVAFRELLCTSEAGVASALALAEQHLQAQRFAPEYWHPGISPHAPYSVHSDLWQQSVALSRRRGMPLASHIAESQEELRWLRDGDGPFQQLLAERSTGGAQLVSANKRPLDFLKQLAGADRSLIIHGNYLDDDEMEFVADHTDRMSIVYCPRTHTYFEHASYPLERLLAAGINVALGTDGRGSNPDLSILAEMRHVAANHPNVSTDRILSLGTINGAAALGLDDHSGTITPGKDANLAIVRLPDRLDEQPADLLLRDHAPTISTIFRGRIAFAEPNVFP